MTFTVGMSVRLDGVVLGGRLCVGKEKKRTNEGEENEASRHEMGRRFELYELRGRNISHFKYSKTSRLSCLTQRWLYCSSYLGSRF